MYLTVHAAIGAGRAHGRVALSACFPARTIVDEPAEQRYHARNIILVATYGAPTAFALLICEEYARGSFAIWQSTKAFEAYLEITETASQ